MINMGINFMTIVNNSKLPITKPLLPLFEAITNSFQSIWEANIQDGFITIKVIRTSSSTKKKSWESDVESFEIEDNGIGFNEKNFKSFITYGSDHKLELGCKGIGRVIWLKAFSNVYIESTYQSEDGRYFDRDFEFKRSGEINVIRNEPSNRNKLVSKVLLERYAKKFKSNCPKLLETLAREIMNHFFTILALDTPLKITIFDDEQIIIVNDFFKECIKNSQQIKEFYIKGELFQIIHTKNYVATTENHLIHYCAHKREVLSDKLSKNILNNLPGKISNEIGDFIYNGYVISEYLDEIVSSDRTGFDFSTNNPVVNGDTEYNQMEFDGSDSSDTINFKVIDKEIIPIIEEYLQDEIKIFHEGKGKKGF